MDPKTSGTDLSNVNEHADITGEIEISVEVQKILEELNIILRILQEQKIIADKLFSPRNNLGMSHNIQDIYLAQSGLEGSIQDVVNMIKASEITDLRVYSL